MKMTKKIHAMIVIVFLSIIALGAYFYHTTSYLREIKSYPVTLTEAYSSTLNVGKGNTQEVFRGRFFHAESNLLLDRSIDGFYYQRFLDGGKKPLAGTLQLSRLDLGEKEPAYAINSFIFAATSILGLFLYSLMAFLGAFNDYDSYRYRR